ncbi:MAG: hypothetical protein Q9225_004525, partial [Loekoesia sp. 1 TL-2023]
DVEVEGGAWNESEWREDLRRLREIVEKRKGTEVKEKSVENKFIAPKIPDKKGREGAAKVEAGVGWSQQVMGAWALLGCALLWGGTSLLDSSR